MLKRFALTLCLCASAVWAGGFMPVAIAQPVTPIVTQEQATSNPSLTLQDLPPGFRELPNNVKSQLQPRLEAFAQQLTQAGMKPDQYFIFINPQTFQLVFGFTGKLMNQPEQAKFDATLKQMQEPEVQQEIIKEYREMLKQAQGIEILDYSAIPELNNIAEASTGMSISVAMQGQPLLMEVAAFRRSNVGAFTAIMYPKDKVPTAPLGAIARKLDTIIQASGGIMPTGTANPDINSPGMPNPDVNSPGMPNPDVNSPGINSTGTGDEGTIQNPRR